MHKVESKDWERKNITNFDGSMMLMIEKLSIGLE